MLEEDLRTRLGEAEQELIAAEKAVESAPNEEVRTVRLELLRICKENAERLRSQFADAVKSHN